MFLKKLFEEFIKTKSGRVSGSTTGGILERSSLAVFTESVKGTPRNTRMIFCRRIHGGCFQEFLEEFKEQSLLARISEEKFL